MKKYRFPACLALLVALTGTVAAAPSTAQALRERTQYNFAAQPLGEALKQLGRQSGLTVMVDSDLVQGRVAPALLGTYTPEEALDRILASSGLRVEFLDANTVAIRSQSGKTAAKTTASTANDGAGVLRVAQNESSGAALQGDETASPPVSDKSSAGPGENLDEVVVTGTHIRGVAPVGAQLIVIDREQIQASGHGRVQEILKDLPQNFSGSASEGGFRTDAGTANFTRGQAVDLRGLGASSTLVLVNGRRQPSGGTEGSFVDISSIAASAVERIEILTDGASALYGADAIGGVVNFVLRKDYDGLETDVRFGSIDGHAEEYQVGLLGGKSWSGGNVLFGYQYAHRDMPMRSDTPYGSMDDYRALGGSDFRIAAGNPGTILDPATFRPAYAIPAGQDGRNLTVAELIPGQANYLDRVSDISWLPRQKHHSAFFALSHPVSGSLEIFAEGRYSRRKTESLGGENSIWVDVPSSNPFYVDPFGTGEPVTLVYSLQELGTLTDLGKTETYTLTTGGTARLSEQWKLNVAVTHGREKNAWEFLNLCCYDSDRILAAISDPDPAAALNVFGDGTANNNPATLDYIRITEFAQGVSTLSSVTAIADGQIFHLPAGSAKLAVGLDYRDERLKADGGYRTPSDGAVTHWDTIVGRLDRQVAAAFGEVVMPVLGDGYGMAKGRSLDVVLAGRYEHYSDFGTTFNPKVGVNFGAIPSLKLRATWGSSFRAPRFNELSTTANQAQAFSVLEAPDPRSPTGVSNVLVLLGSNPNIHEETADMWTAGFDIAPTAIPGISVAATYFNLQYRGKIQAGGNGGETLLLEEQWTEIVTRDPTQAQIDAVCNSPGFLDASCPPAVAAIIDGRLRNLAVVDVDGVDLDLKYRTAIALGRVQLGLGGTRLLTYNRASSSTAPSFDVLDTVRNPLDLRLRATASWNHNGWQVHSAINYAGGYHNPGDRAVPNRSVDSWTTLDASVSYQFLEGGWLEGTRIQLSALNLLDEKPPFVNRFTGADDANAGPNGQLGRSMSLALRRSW